MKWTRWVLAAVPAGLCLSVSCQFAKVDREENPSPEALPTQLEHYLEESLPTCAVITREDYSPDDVRLFAPKWQVTGDFDGNGKQDVGLLMKCPSEGNVLIVGVHITTTGGFEHFVLERLPGGRRMGVTLETEGPGLVSVSMADEEDRRKRIPTAAISVSLLETCYNKLHYWGNGHYESVYRGL